MGLAVESEGSWHPMPFVRACGLGCVATTWRAISKPRQRDSYTNFMLSLLSKNCLVRLTSR